MPESSRCFTTVSRATAMTNSQLNGRQASYHAPEWEKIWGRPQVGLAECQRRNPCDHCSAGGNPANSVTFT